MNNKDKNSTEVGKGLIKTVYSSAATIIILALINVTFSPGHYWFIYPAFFIALGVIFQLFNYFGHKAAEKYEGRRKEKEIEEEEELELRQFEKNRHKEGRNWDEKDFV